MTSRTYVKSFGWLVSMVFCSAPLFGQVDVPHAADAKTPEEMKQVLAQAFAQDTFADLPGPYHLLATFETFTEDGKPDGEGSIEKFFVSPGHTKVIRRFRDRSMTEYRNGGPPSFTDDGYQGSIMSYFVNNFLLNPLPPPAGLARRNIETKTMQLGGPALDCGMYQFFVGPPGSPARPKEVLCVTRDGLELALAQTIVFSVRYKESAPFLGRSIPRYIYAAEGPVVRCRIHVQLVDEQKLEDQALVPPGGALSVEPGPVWRATSAAEDAPLQSPFPSSLRHAPGVRGDVPGEFLVLRSTTGQVMDVQPVYAPNREVQQAAVDALKQWTFSPLIRQGRAVETISTVHLNFAMR